jgi:hypothetical protein
LSETLRAGEGDAAARSRTSKRRSDGRGGVRGGASTAGGGLPVVYGSTLALLETVRKEKRRELGLDRPGCGLNKGSGLHKLGLEKFPSKTNLRESGFF